MREHERAADAAGVHVVEELDLCCKSKRCPLISVLSDGGLVVRDAESGGEPVRFTAAQAGELRRLLERHGY